LKRESPKEQWRSYLERLILDTKKKHRYELLSRIYYAEKDYRNAYEYAKDLRDFGYLEVLAGKLTTTHSELACQLYRQLCFDWISQGAGWPYEKAGKMLSAMKHLDKNGLFFKKTKEELIKTYRKKYSLMQIIERI
jgi:elongation factor P hydroxylase